MSPGRRSGLMAGGLVALLVAATATGRAAEPAWIARLGPSAAVRSTVLELAKAQERVPLPPPGSPLRSDSWAPIGDACSALVNLHILSGEARYRDGARRIADHLLAWNDYLIAHRDPAIPYLGWGPRERKGYFGCATIDDFHADDLWDTAAALRCLLKVSEIAGGPPVASSYYQRARRIALAWPFVEHRPGPGWQKALAGDGPYAAAGLRFYRKSSLPCEDRYVKNTNLAFGEQLLRLYLLGREEAVLAAALKVLGAQLWDLLVHGDLAYASYMTYLDTSAPGHRAQVEHNDGKVVALRPGQPGAGLRCGDRDASCWSHLGFEGYALGNILWLLGAVDAKRLLVASTARDVQAALGVTMGAFRTSAFGDAARFDWAGAQAGTLSATHVTAYACALRLLPDPGYAEGCERALGHHPRGGTVLYGLVPDAIVAAPARVAD